MAFSQKTVVAIGKFDGVHKGHQKLLNTASDLAKKNKIYSVALVINQASAKTILPPATRDEIIKSHGISHVIRQDMTPEFMNMSAEEFVSGFLIGNLNCAHVVVGYNFRFAKKRSADVGELENLCKKHNIGCTVIPEVICSFESQKITASSTAVRDYLENGDVYTASQILGRDFCICGEVVHGKQIGTTIGVPTANIKCSEGLILPGNGVYVSRLELNGKEYKAITNIGKNPTVNGDDKIKIETHIPGFTGNIYGEKIKIEFLKRIRDEKKFSSLDELKKQIKKDIACIR